jgi:branched-subunit amino acid transport protein
MGIRMTIADRSPVIRIRYREIIDCAVVGSLGILLLDALILRPGVNYIADSEEPLRSVAVHSIMERFQDSTFFRPFEYLVLVLANNIYLPLWLGVSLLSVVGATILSALACERLFDSQLTKAGWAIFGIANPLLFYLVTTPGAISQCLCNLLFAGALLAYISELRLFHDQSPRIYRADRVAVLLNILAAALFFTKETAVAAAVLLPATTALIRFKKRQLSYIFLLSLLIPIGAAGTWILIKLQFPLSTYITPGMRYSPKLDPISWGQNFILTLAFPVTPLPSSFLGFQILRPLWLAVALGSLALFMRLLVRESMRKPKIMLPLVVIAASCMPMILIHENELYSSMLAPFAVATALLFGIPKFSWPSLAYGLMLYSASLGNGIVYSLGPDFDLLGLQRLPYSIYSKYYQHEPTCPISTTAHIGWDGSAFICMP